MLLNTAAVEAAVRANVPQLILGRLETYAAVKPEQIAIYAVSGEGAGGRLRQRARLHLLLSDQGRAPAQPVISPSSAAAMKGAPCA